METYKKTRFYFTSENKIHYIETEKDDITMHLKFEKDFQYQYIEMQNGYTADKEGLISYMKDYNKWSYWLKNHKIDMTQYKNINDMVIGIFKSRATNALKKNSIAKMNYTEFKYSQKCSNGGLISLDKCYVDKEIDCFGYDFSNFYAWLLGDSDLEIAVDGGKEIKIETLDFPLKYGYYKVNISNTQQYTNLYKVHMICKTGYYTHYSLNFLKSNFPEVIIQPDTEQENNALIFENTIQTKVIFGSWFKRVSELKKKAKKNKLVKRMCSSLWGLLTQYDRTYVNSDEYKNLDVSNITKWERNTEYKIIGELYRDEDDFTKIVVKSNDPYKHNLAKLKSFLTSYGRTIVGQTIIDENILNDVIRIYTDGIVLNKEHIFKNDHIIQEDKTTGKFIWKNATYNNITWETRKSRYECENDE